jgi:hypothetical protein
VTIELVGEQRGTRAKLLAGSARLERGWRRPATERPLAAVEADGDGGGRTVARGWGTARG